MKIKATKVKAKDLKPGELFSTEGQFYWDHTNPEAVGEKVYIRTELPCTVKQRKTDIYRIEILK